MRPPTAGAKRRAAARYASLALASSALSCVVEAPPPRPFVPAPGAAWLSAPPTTPGTEQPPGAFYGAPPAPQNGTPLPTLPAGGTAPGASTHVTRLSDQIPDGDACLAALAQLGVAHRRLDQKRGVRTPIVVNGPIGGLRFWANGETPLVCDCRLAVALAWSAPELARLGTSAVRFSGAWVYRLARTGKLSLHAYGLAIDVHELVVQGRTVSVEQDFARRLAGGCAPAAPVVNRVACRLRQLGLWKEILGPDFDADHHDHLHLGIAPLPLTAPAAGSVAPASAP